MSIITEDASAWFDLGVELQNSNRHEEALKAFDQALEIDPDFPFLRHRIAVTHYLLNNYDLALSLHEALVRDFPRDAHAWSFYSMAAHACRQWDKALAAAERAFALAPNDAKQLFHFSIILGDCSRFKRERHLLNRALTLDPENANVRFRLGHLQLTEGDYLNGWKMVESRWQLSTSRKYLPTIENAQIPRWTGESLDKKNLLAWGEPWQGHGDTVLFARYMGALAERAKREGGLIVLQCHEPMRTLLARSLAEHCNELFLSSGGGLPIQPQHFLGRKPFYCSQMALPLYLGGAIPDTYPYLKPDPIKVEAWRERISSS